MKIDTDSPRLPINRLKRPLKQITPEPEDLVETADESAFADSFERRLLRDGAQRFEKWLEKIEIK